MVQNTRTPKGTDGVRPLGVPQPIEVRADQQGRPVAVKVDRRWVPVTVGDRWRIDDEWWREVEVSRVYFALLAEDRPIATVYQELLENRWFSQGYSLSSLSAGSHSTYTTPPSFRRSGSPVTSVASR